MIKRITILSILLLISTLSFTQNKHVQAADNAFEKEYYSTAIEKYKKAYSKTKKNRVERARIASRLGDCYSLTGKEKNAESQYKAAIRGKYDKRDSTVILKYANVLRFNEKYDLAKEQYLAYLDIVPGDPLALAGLESCEKITEWLKNPDKCEITTIKTINSKNSDFSPTWGDLSYTSIIFTSSREAAKGKQNDEWTGEKFSDIFVASHDVKGKWSQPVPIDEENIINTSANEGTPSTNYRGNRLYYTYCPDSKDIYVGCRIYVARRNGKTYSDPKEVKLGGDSTCVSGHPALTDDELTIVFASERIGGLGGKDLYVATRESTNSDFGTPINLGNKINTKGNEMFPHFRNDSTLYFASDGHPGLGGLDIFYVYLDRNKIPQSLPINVGAPINSSSDDFGILFHPEKNEGYFSSNRKGGRGGDDIYGFVVPPLEFTLTGTITDEKTLQYVHGAKVVITGTDGSIIQSITNNNGEYIFSASQLKPETTYDIIIEKDNYLTITGKETTVGLSTSENFVRDFILSPIPDQPVVLPDILYDFAKWDLKPQYQDSLQGLITTLNLNPTIVIELASHTDMIGSIESNDALSQRRAESVVDYLIQRGINSRRLVAKGYGERKPRTLHKDYTINGNFFAQGTTLTEDYINGLSTQSAKDAANQLNRRTEFSIISKDFVSDEIALQNESIDDVRGIINIVIDPNKNYINYVVTKDNKTVSKCIANGYTLNFEYEERMSDNYISQAKAIDFLRKGVITIDDVEGDATRAISQGSIADRTKIIIKTMRFGSKEIENIPVVVNSKIPYDLVLNKKTLDRVGMVIFDEGSKLIIFE
ncbi:OmpA family protein [Odoribacter sp. OttesenSCG-928-L07]|nr:OmpA family protein [Odoribacter sp. OttesenSCG-928-L07]MDL2239600.1 OmpA family protein [Bacteroidales bacterium OttesenSCG-928-L14]MDL2240762.1 OmpA family protein [Bacteroidales bacterium OttesenSCG-928-K22]